MPGPTPQSKAEIEAAAHDYGIAPGGRAMVLAELDAADYSIASGVYVVWRTQKTGESASGVRKDGQCCRVGPNSRCFCGHSLADHKPIKQGNPQAPACAKCKCRRFSYVPMRPEECGMWHLPRRKGAYHNFYAGKGSNAFLGERLFSTRLRIDSRLPIQASTCTLGARRASASTATTRTTR